MCCYVVVVFYAKKGCKKKSLNKFSLAAYLRNATHSLFKEDFLKLKKVLPSFSYLLASFYSLYTQSAPHTSSPWYQNKTLLFSSLSKGLSKSVRLHFQWCCLTDRGSPTVMQHVMSVESSSLLLHSIQT